MAASAGVTALVDQLIALFNRKSLDLPDGLFSRHTQFRLNGVPFEERLGRSPSDPLVLMLTRGPAGYRFALKAVQHAIPDALLERGDLHEQDSDGTVSITGQGWLSGTLRGSAEPAELLFDIELVMRGTSVERASVTLDPQALARVQEARLRP